MLPRSAGQIAAEKQGAGIRCAALRCNNKRKFHNYGKAIPSYVPDSELKTGVIRSEEVLCNSCYTHLRDEAIDRAAPLPTPDPPVTPVHAPATVATNLSV